MALRSWRALIPSRGDRANSCVLEVRACHLEVNVDASLFPGTKADDAGGASTLLNKQIERLDRIKRDVKGLRRDMPGIVADALRDTRRTD